MIDDSIFASNNRCCIRAWAHSLPPWRSDPWLRLLGIEILKSFLKNERFFRLKEQNKNEFNEISTVGLMVAAAHLHIMA